MKVYHDPIIPGWPWILEKDNGQLSHHTTEEKANQYRDWIAGKDDDDGPEEPDGPDAASPVPA